MTPDRMTECIRLGGGTIDQKAFDAVIDSLGDNEEKIAAMTGLMTKALACVANHAGNKGAIMVGGNVIKTIADAAGIR